jgi:DNA polymerase-3 subunit delta'
MWHGLDGHDEIAAQFRQTLASGRLASTYLFVGPPGIGKKRFAVQLAQSLLCTASDEAALEPCGQCQSCRLFAAGRHPDLDVVGLPADKSTLPIEMFIGDKEHRNQEGLCHRLGLRPFFGRRKVAIVDDADHFSIPSANCLLKTLEEPPPSALLILIGTTPSRQLPTIRSRSQVVRFEPLAAATVAKILLETGAVTDPSQARHAADLSEGSVDRAMKLVDPALWEFREQLYGELSSQSLNSVRMARSIQSFVDEASKESSQRRDRLRIVIGFAVDNFRARLRHGTATETEPAIEALDACLQALEYIDRNANLGLVIQNWCEVLAKFGSAAGSQLRVSAHART